ncbi:hypothetical protein ACHAPA_000393 [Fusarium lateritium]
MDGMSVENLQALSIIAFTDMGNGDMSRAWPIIGSLTRTVEYLQLSVEMDDRQQGPLLKPLTSLPPSKNWTQDEERRRVFWNIFNLDRLCSVMTGWNTSLTSDDVRRRLPADGGLWHKEETVLTPYFGIWDRSAAKMGNSIVFLPAHYPSPEQATEPPPETPSTNTTAPKGNDTVDMTTVGAFAYCIEATESLSRVTTYFLQQRINFRDRQEVGNWLTRFKELDLRLVHARALLVHWRYYKTELAPEFWVLVDSLDDFAKRWAGPLVKSKVQTCLAGKYSAQLRALHKRCAESPEYSPDVVGYSTDGFITQGSGYSPNDQDASLQVFRPNDSVSDLLDPSLATGALNQLDQMQTHIPNHQLNFLPQISPTNQGLEHHSPDELSAISTVLMDQDFMQMDRVISFDDMMFTAQTIDDQGGPFSMNNWTLG